MLHSIYKIHVRGEENMKYLIIFLLVGCSFSPDEYCKRLCAPDGVKRITKGWNDSCECHPPKGQCFTQEEFKFRFNGKANQKRKKKQ
jgi:hypothetical protein